MIQKQWELFGEYLGELLRTILLGIINTANAAIKFIGIPWMFSVPLIAAIVVFITIRRRNIHKMEQENAPTDPEDPQPPA